MADCENGVNGSGDEAQLDMFGGAIPRWVELWAGMPEFSLEDLTPVRSIIVHFETVGDVALFEALIGQSLGRELRSVWYPEAEITRLADKRYANE
jgi:hypothetical protein